MSEIDLGIKRSIKRGSELNVRESCGKQRNGGTVLLNINCKT